MLVAKARLKNGVATAFHIENGKEVAFFQQNITTPHSHDEEALTKEQNKIYKEIIYSKVGREIVNEYKNKHLLKDEYSQRWLNKLFSILSSKGKNLVSDLIEDPINIKRVKKIDRVNMIKEDVKVNMYCFNRSSFKEMGITKKEILELFRKRKLINF